MLEVKNLCAYYGEAQALHDLSLHVEPGEVVTLVGRNGAGKSTTLRSVMGLHRHTTGSISFDGRDITGMPAHRRAAKGMGWVQDDRGVYSTLSVEENLTLPPVVSKEHAWSLDRIYTSFPILKERRSARGTTLSGGEQQMLAVARVLRMGAKLLLLDEPTEGLAPVIVADIREILLEAKKLGTTVLLVEQNVGFAASVADRHYILAEGSLRADLHADEFEERKPELMEYLGL